MCVICPPSKRQATVYREENNQRNEGTESQAHARHRLLADDAPKQLDR